MPRVPLIRRLARAERRGLAVSALAVGAAIGLVLLLQGLWAGQLVQLTAYEDHVDADLFVAQRGVESMLGDESLIPENAVRRIRLLPGVIRADPVHLHYSVASFHDRPEFVLLVGYTPGGAGGPWDLRTGRPVQDDSEVVIDAILAADHGVAVGDTIPVGSADFLVVGLSRGTRSWMTSLVFMTADAATALTGGGLPSFLLVDADHPSAVAGQVESVADLEALPPAVLAAGDRAVLSGVMARPVRLMIGVSFVAAVSIVSFAVYAAVVGRLRDYGVMKALGAGGRRLTVLVLGQSLLVALGGTMVGLLAYLAGSRLIRALRPQFWFSLGPGQVLVVVTASVVMAGLALVLPTRRLARLEPAAVYRRG